MKRFFTFLKTELKLSLRDMNMPIFAIIMPLVIFIILGIIYGTKPAYDGADYTFMEQSFGAVSAVAICASGLMGLPLAVSDLREMKILKRLRVTPVSPVFILGVELTMYIV
jgi:ABC transporter family protein